MKKNILLFCCLTLACTAFSQKRVKSGVEKAVVSTAQTEPTDISAEINKYQFDAAAALLQKQQAKAKRQKLSTELLDVQLQKCRMGSNMLRATEKVMFIDSVVVERDKFLSALMLGKESGKIDYYNNFFKSGGAQEKLQHSTVYISDFEDKVYFPNPDENGRLKINVKYKTNDEWGKSVQLDGIGEADDIQDFPFVMADGVTLYYAAQSEESLGGYDIFVTRYNSDTKQFLKPENIGMPFNSPANDYLFAIDELNNLGWFVTDRNQPADKVCVYIFIPTAQRETYDLSAYPDGKVADLARINAISDTQTDRATVESAKARLADLVNQNIGRDTKNKKEFVFFLNDKTIYTQFAQFKSAKARDLAKKLIAYQETQRKSNELLEKLRSIYPSLTKQKKEQAASEILKLETDVLNLKTAIHSAEKEIRKEESGN